jgi:hypothetical protein
VPINYDQLNTGEADVQTPDDGAHVAILDRASLVDTRSGEQVVTEWRDAKDYTVQWQSWNRFEGAGFPYTRDLLVGLGVPLGKNAPDGTPLIMDDDGLRREIAIAQGGMFNVRTVSRQGDGRVFVNTYVDGLTMGGVQLDISSNVEALNQSARIEPDVPIDTDGLPEPSSGPVPVASAQRPPTPAPGRGGAQRAAQSPTGAGAEVLPWEDDKVPF